MFLADPIRCRQLLRLLASPTGHRLRTCHRRRLRHRPKLQLIRSSRRQTEDRPEALHSQDQIRLPNSRGHHNNSNNNRILRRLSRISRELILTIQVCRRLMVLARSINRVICCRISSTKPVSAWLSADLRPAAPEPAAVSSSTLSPSSSGSTAELAALSASAWPSVRSVSRPTDAASWSISCWAS